MFINVVKYILILCTIFIIIAGVLAPILASVKEFVIADKFYHLLAHSCHQQPLRSFWIAGYPMAFCARCFGIYIGALVALITPKKELINLRIMIALSILVIGMFELLLEIFAGLQGSNIIRLLSGLFIGWAIFEITILSLCMLRRLLTTKMKKLKKLFSVLLAGLLIILNSSVYASTISLMDFIRDNKKIEVNFEYPSYKVADINGEYPLVNTIIIPSGTPVVISNNQYLDSSQIHSGDKVYFTIVNEVKIDGKTLIKAGSQVDATITFAKKKGMIGEPGVITISDFSTKAVDGSMVPLRARVYATGQDKSDLSLILGVTVCLPFLLMKGKDAVLPNGVTRTAYTQSEVKVNYIKPAKL